MPRSAIVASSSGARWSARPCSTVSTPASIALPGARQALSVRRHAVAQPMRLVDDGGHLLERHLRWLGVLALDGSGAGGHDLDVVGPVADLFADGLAHLPRPVGLAIHRAEDAGSGRRGGQDPAA